MKASNARLFGFILAFAMLLPCCAVSGANPIGSMLAPQSAYAAVHVGDADIEGWKPSEMASTDMTVAADPSEAAVTLEAVVIRLVKIAMPFLMIACVAIIVFNGIANIFRPQETRVKMGDLIKNMFVNFFWILFAWVIVEIIVFVVTNGEMILFNTILGLG